MTDHRRRPPEGTVKSRIWLLLRTVGSMTAELVAERLGRDQGREAVRRTIHALIRAGRVGKVAVRRTCVMYYAIGRKVPHDRRGKPMACRNHRGAQAYASWVRLMTRKHGPAWRPPVRPAIGLEVAWPITIPVPLRAAHDPF